MKRKLIYILFPLALLFACLGFAACGAPNELAAPENLRIVNGILLWNEVKHADGYYVYIDENEYQTRECGYDVSGLDETQIHTLEVRAYNKKGLLSPYADLTYTGKFAVITEGLEYTGGGSDYRVTKFAVDENGSCVIPDTYQGLPVYGFDATTTPIEILSRIKHLYLPNSIRDAFLTGSRMKYFPNLESIGLGGHEENFIIEGNCLINKEKNTLVVGCIGSTIPDYVTTIGEDAFHGRNITTIDMSNSVTQIGSSAFSHCTPLTTIDIPSSVTRIDGSAFASCVQLTEFTVPNSVTMLGNAVFSDCTLLEKVILPERITTKSLMKTFSGCTSLKSVKIPEGVTVLSETFRDCTSLTDVTLPESAKSLSKTFRSCTSLKSVKIPESVTEMSETFWFCSSLESFTIPGTVKYPKSVFYGCTSLKSVTLAEGVEGLGATSSISGAAWGFCEGCTSLTEVNFSSTVTSIGLGTFANCTSLKSIVIPESVTEIWKLAFENCTSLKSIVIPESLTRIREYAFENCPIEEIYYHGTEAELKENVTIDEYANETLLSAEWYFYSETQPEEEGNFWHYVNGVPTKWT